MLQFQFSYTDNKNYNFSFKNMKYILRLRNINYKIEIKKIQYVNRMSRWKRYWTDLRRLRKQKWGRERNCMELTVKTVHKLVSLGFSLFFKMERKQKQPNCVNMNLFNYLSKCLAIQSFNSIWSDFWVFYTVEVLKPKQHLKTCSSFLIWTN